MAAGAVAIGALLYLGGRSEGAGGTGKVVSGAAPAFTLPSTDGNTVSLADFKGRNVLLFFSEGVGCAPCFYQMLDIEKNARLFSDAGITVLPIVANPADQVRQEAQQFGVTTPYLIDADTSVTKAYGRLGKGMHADLPGHGFVLLDGSGRIRWEKEYPSMYVSAADLFAQLEPNLR